MTSVLVVEDEKLIRWSVRQKLESRGYHVVEAEDCANAILLFTSNLPDLVTLDIRLPDGNGLNLLVEMKRLAPQVPIVMITALGTSDDAVKALKLGACACLGKPINFGQLLGCLKTALERVYP